jgi:hypothetical protein
MDSGYPESCRKLCWSSSCLMRLTSALSYSYWRAINWGWKTISLPWRTRAELIPAQARPFNQIVVEQLTPSFPR